MEYHIKARSKRTKLFIESIMPSMIKQLGLTRSKKLLCIKVTKDMGDDGNDGMTSYLQRFDSIIILIKPSSLEKMGVTLAHEMVHAKQLAKGKLKTVKGVSYWNGKRFSKKTKYLDQPWEIEAFSKQELIFRRAIQ